MLLSNSTSNKRKSVYSLIFAVSLLLTAPHSAWSQGTSTTFTATLFNMEKAANETFRYSTTLKNNTSSTQKYELKATAPEGWRVSFKTRGSNVTSINLDAKKTETISIEVKPSYASKPDKYEIAIQAISDTEITNLMLEAVVSGSYDLQLTTPTGLLSGAVVEGKTMPIKLKVKNTGSLPLTKLNLTSSTPTKWEATFSPSTIDALEPGESMEVSTLLTVPEKTLPGDYISKFTVKNSQTKSTADYRVTVETSVLAGWMGILVILLSIAIVFFLVRKFGRR